MIARKRPSVETTKRHISVFAPLVFIVGFAACTNDFKRDIGLERDAPDEFQVVRGKPLIIPPDASLRPPGSATASRSDTRTSREARDIVTNGTAVDLQGVSPGEQALLAATAVEAMPDIRTVILEETTQRRQLAEDRFLFILDFQRRNIRSVDEDPIDPKAEAERLEAEGLARKVITIRTGSSQSTGAGS